MSPVVLYQGGLCHLLSFYQGALVPCCHLRRDSCDTCCHFTPVDFWLCCNVLYTWAAGHKLLCPTLLQAGWGGAALLA